MRLGKMAAPALARRPGRDRQPYASPMLPDGFSWIHSADGFAYLHYHFKRVAYVHPDGRVQLQGWRVNKLCPGRSQAHSVRMVERWVLGRLRCGPGWP